MKDAWELTKEDIKEILNKMEETGANILSLDISLWDAYRIQEIDFELWKDSDYIDTVKELY